MTTRGCAETLMAATLLRNLVPIIGTHKALPQTIFRVAPDPLRFTAALDKPKHSCLIKKGDTTFVLSTQEQGSYTFLLISYVYTLVPPSS
jgi:hypothetical protein